MAASVPITSEMQVDRNAIWAESQSAESTESASRILAYQRSEKPRGGNENTGEAENEIGITVRIGSARNSSTSVSITALKIRPKRMVSSGSRRAPGRTTRTR